MPYIIPIERKVYDSLIKDLAVHVNMVGGISTPGHLNYIVTKLIKEVYGPEQMRYWQHNEIIGMLECCKQEFYRHRTGPYEDICIAKNGDV